MATKILKTTAYTTIGIGVIATGYAFYSSSQKKKAIENATTNDIIPLSCTCGKFKAQVTVPANDPMPAVHVTCYCSDCRKWADDIAPGGKSRRTSTGDELFMVSKGQVKVLTPDLVDRVRLYPDTPLHRYKTVCCSTAIGGAMEKSPTCAISAVLLEPSSPAKIKLEELSKPHYRIRLGKEFTGDLNSFDGPAGRGINASSFLLHFVQLFLSSMYLQDPPMIQTRQGEQVIFPKQLKKDEN
jgi:hypothetical protein